MTRYQRGGLPSSVLIFQGPAQYGETFFAILKEARGSCDYFGSVDDFLKMIPMSEQERWLNERVGRGLSARTLTTPGAHATRISKEDKKYLRETRVLKELSPFVTSFHLFADKVIFWQPDSLLAIRIEDDLIAGMMRSIFEFLWVRAKTVG